MDWPGGAMTRICFLGLLLTALGLSTIPGHAQKWPERTIRIVVGFPPGPTDIVSRPIADRLSKALGQPVVVENRPGANGSIAAEQVMRADPDGYTLLVGTSGTHVTAVHLFKNLRYDPVKDFAPIVAMVEPATCLVVNPNLPVTSVPELVAYAKANPGKLSYASPGVGSVFHLLGELFQQTTGTEMVHVAYKGIDPALSDLIGGHIPVAFTALSSAAPHIEAKSVRILAVLDSTRFSRVPDVPSISEFIPAFQKPSTWFGFFAPRGTPDPIIKHLNTEIVRIMNEPDIHKLLEDNSYTMLGGSPEHLKTLMIDGIAQFGKIIQAAGIKPE
jgi:tripartite-type tricarboxylate transporter receptor subunit TctC